LAPSGQQVARMVIRLHAVVSRDWSQSTPKIGNSPEIYRSDKRGYVTSRK
jgi:hypothetical protein